MPSTPGQSWKSTLGSTCVAGRQVSVDTQIPHPGAVQTAKLLILHGQPPRRGRNTDRGLSRQVLIGDASTGILVYLSVIFEFDEGESSPEPLTWWVHRQMKISRSSSKRTQSYSLMTHGEGSCCASSDPRALSLLLLPCSRAQKGESLRIWDANEAMVTTGRGRCVERLAPGVVLLWAPIP